MGSPTIPRVYTPDLNTGWAAGQPSCSAARARAINHAAAGLGLGDPAGHNSNTARPALAAK